MYLKNFKTIVIKIGSSLLINDTKTIRKKWLSEFAKDIKDLLNDKKKVIIVSSGAIALGCKKLNLNKKKLKLDKSQSVASIGQIELMNLYQNVFKKLKIKISQILLTLDDTEQRRRSINARRTIDNLLTMGIVPIVNENDTTATTEIKYGDNDRLAARVSQIISADCLILLSDVDGLYTDNPKKNKETKLIKIVKKIHYHLKNTDDGYQTIDYSYLSIVLSGTFICAIASQVAFFLLSLFSSNDKEFPLTFWQAYHGTIYFIMVVSMPILIFRNIKLWSYVLFYKITHVVKLKNRKILIIVMAIALVVVLLMIHGVIQFSKTIDKN